MIEDKMEVSVEREPEELGINIRELAADELGRVAGGPHVFAMD